MNYELFRQNCVEIVSKHLIFGVSFVYNRKRQDTGVKTSCFRYHLRKDE